MGEEAWKGGDGGGGRGIIMAEIDDFNREIELTRKNKKLMKLFDERAKQTKLIELDEVKKELGLK